MKNVQTFSGEGISRTPWFRDVRPWRGRDIALRCPGSRGRTPQRGIPAIRGDGRSTKISALRALCLRRRIFKVSQGHSRLLKAVLAYSRGLGEKLFFMRLPKPILSFCPKLCSSVASCSKIRAPSALPFQAVPKRPKVFQAVPRYFQEKKDCLFSLRHLLLPSGWTTCSPEKGRLMYLNVFNPLTLQRNMTAPPETLNLQATRGSETLCAPSCYSDLFRPPPGGWRQNHSVYSVQNSGSLRPKPAKSRPFQAYAR